MASRLTFGIGTQRYGEEFSVLVDRVQDYIQVVMRLITASGFVVMITQVQFYTCW